MKACTWCGRENNSDAAFCRECGTELSVTPLAPTQIPAEGPAAVGDRTLGHVSKRRPRAVLGSISLALSGLWPLALAGLLLDQLLGGSSGPDEITGGMGAASAIGAVLVVLVVIAGVGAIVGIFGLYRGEQPRWPARLGILLGSIPAGLVLLVLLLLFFSRFKERYLP